MSWYDKYMSNLVSISTIDKLVAAGKIDKEERDRMVNDRKEQFGY